MTLRSGFLAIVVCSSLVHGAEPFAHAEREGPEPELNAEPDESTTALWPQPNHVHPAVLAMKGEEGLSINSIARYVLREVENPFQRVKALHDVVVTRLTYTHVDVQSQDALSVFKRKTAKCEGYARLFYALCAAAGMKVEYITGLALEEGASKPAWHAWNAVLIDGQWYLVDSTFDDPTISGDGPSDAYRSDYLFIPPQVAALDHLPNKARWQLKMKPTTQAQFLNSTRARPGMIRQGLTLLSPVGAVTADTPVSFQLSNNASRYVLITLDGIHCGISSANPLTLTCPGVTAGMHRAQILTNTSATGLFLSVITFDLEVR